MHSCIQVFTWLLTHVHTPACSFLFTHIYTLTGITLPVHTHTQSQIPGLMPPYTRTCWLLTHPCADSNTQAATFPSPSRPPAPNPRFSHRGSLIMGSRQTCETSSCCAIISGKKLGVGKRLLNLEGLLLWGDSEEEGKKESSTEDGKPSSEQGIMGISRDHLAAFINPRVYFFPLLLDKFMETDSHSRRRQLHPPKQSSL